MNVELNFCGVELTWDDSFGGGVEEGRFLVTVFQQIMWRIIIG